MDYNKLVLVTKKIFGNNWEYSAEFQGQVANIRAIFLFKRRIETSP